MVSVTFGFYIFVSEDLTLCAKTFSLFAVCLTFCPLEQGCWQLGLKSIYYLLNNQVNKELD